jgi:peptidase S24-like protein
MASMALVPAVWRPLVTEVLRERIGAGEPTWLPVRGRSMRPLLASGSRILVAPAVHVRFGDLLAYECEGAVVCHRVIGRRGADRMTRADHRGAGPELVRPDQIVGVVTALERGGAVIPLTRPARRAQAVVRAARSLGAAAWAAARRRAWRRA